MNQKIPSRAPEPTEAVVTHWNSDPYARGSYSVGAMGGKPSDRAALAKAVDGKLFFAGEAVHLTTNATVHGAYLTGFAAASDVSKSVAGNRQQSCSSSLG